MVVDADELGARHSVSSASAADVQVIAPVTVSAASGTERRLHPLDSQSTDVVQPDCYRTHGSGPLIAGALHEGTVGAPQAVETW